MCLEILGLRKNRIFVGLSNFLSNLSVNEIRT